MFCTKTINITGNVSKTTFSALFSLKKEFFSCQSTDLSLIGQHQPIIHLFFFICNFREFFQFIFQIFPVFLKKQNYNEITKNY